MENNDFDKQIREKLQNLEAKYRPGDWELMEQKINGAEVDANPEFEDVLLDGIAYGSLENFKADYEPSHWNLMEQKLDDAYSIRRKLYRYKVAEVSLMLLAIFTVIQFLPFKKHNTSSELAGLENLAITDLSIANAISENEKSNQQTTKSSFSDVESENLTNTSETSNSDVDIPSAAEKNNTQIALSSKSGIGLVINHEPSDNNLEVNIPNIEEANHFIKKNIDLSIANRFAFSDRNNVPQVSILQPINSYKLEKISSDNASDLPENLAYNTISSSILVSIGMLGGADADYITTPYDDQYHQNEIGQFSVGYSGGFTLGIKYHKWELETGAIYAAKYYESRNILEVNGSFEDGGYVQQGLSGVQLDIVKVPLQLRYNFMSHSKWNIYAHSGASFNMAVETLFEYTSENVGNSSTNAIVGRSANPHQTPSYDGVFEGGNLIDNTFITANLGLGIERHFNSRMSIFLGSTYQHQITKGLGPQSDKINSLSIMTGARVTLQYKNKN
jgi:hypothetical protein